MMSCGATVGQAKAMPGTDMRPMFVMIDRDEPIESKEGNRDTKS